MYCFCFFFLASINFEIIAGITWPWNLLNLSFIPYTFVGIKQIISHASNFYTLYPGDIIMAGSPLGFEPVVPGDILVADFEKIGRMEVRVRAHEI